MGSTYEVSGLTQSRGRHWPAPMVFQNLHLNWNAPAFHMILGPSGGGKSTLLKTLAGVWRPLHGSILIDGEPLWQANALIPNRHCAQRIGYAFQNNALFSSMRVVENISYPLITRGRAHSKSEATEIAMTWLQRVGLENSAWQFPQEMSGGMQKRLAIARALVLEPDVLFLDDPTAGLDPVTSQNLMALILELLSQKSGLVVMVTNDVDRAREASAELHFLVDGQLIGQTDARYSACQERFVP